MAIQSNAMAASGIGFYIGGVASDAMLNSPDSSDYDGVSWVKVGEVTNIGELMEQWNMAEHAPLDSDRIEPLKANRTMPVITVNFARKMYDGTDAGQVALMEAFDDKHRAYAFRVLLNDGDIAEITDEASAIMFAGLVTSRSRATGGSQDVVARAVDIQPLLDSIADLQATAYGA